jgi:LPXTG-motif cell wall-anchored protein
MLPILAAIVIVGLMLVLALLLLRRRKKKASDAPATTAPAATIVLPVSEAPRTPTGAPLDPTDINVNIFAVGFPNRETLRVGYNFFPAGTVVYFRVVDLDVDVRGQFTTEGGGSTRHFVEVPLSSALGEDRDGAEVDFNWTIGSVPFAYKVASRVTRL